MLHAFAGPDGAHPTAGLIADSAGNLYGTTSHGGASGNGVVFKLSPGGTETVLYAFTGGSDGGTPDAGLIADSAGNLYGTTFFGAAGGNGVVFKLSPPATAGGAWTETVLYSFTGGSDGFEPSSGLIADSAGNLYGTTNAGGASGKGVVFKLAATGFVTAIPFSAFSAKLEFELGRRPNHDSFELESEFILGRISDGINPVDEPVTLKIGTFATTIPPGSFKKDRDGDKFTFEGTIHGVRWRQRSK